MADSEETKRLRARQLKKDVLRNKPSMTDDDYQKNRDTIAAMDRMEEKRQAARKPVKLLTVNKK